MLGVTEVEPCDTFLWRRMWEIIWEKLHMSSDPRFCIHFLFSSFKNTFSRFFLFSTEDIDSVLLNLKIDLLWAVVSFYTLLQSLFLLAFPFPFFIIVQSQRKCFHYFYFSLILSIYFTKLIPLAFSFFCLYLFLPLFHFIQPTAECLFLYVQSADCRAEVMVL